MLNAHNAIHTQLKIGQQIVIVFPVENKDSLKKCTIELERRHFEKCKVIVTIVFEVIYQVIYTFVKFGNVLPQRQQFLDD